MCKSDEESFYDDVKVPSFFDAVKGLETFLCYNESIKIVPEEVFKNFRQLYYFQLQITGKNSKAKDYT